VVTKEYELDNLTPIDDQQGSEAQFEIAEPEIQSIPFVFASPHSGRNYPTDFIAASRLDPLMLRRSEDSFIDEIFAAAPDYGAPLLKACFPRAYVDPNREAYELDPSMFEDDLPDFVNTKSARVFAGLGTVARVVTNGENIYNRKLTFAEADARIVNSYQPYHAALRGLIANTLDRFGKCLLIDCHSMPSIGGPMDDDSGNRRVDIVLGNNHGATCDAELMNFVDRTLSNSGLVVRRNSPYSGGFTTRFYGQPKKRVHGLQIEINRALYMNEETIERGPGFGGLVATMTNLVAALAEFDLKV